MFPANCTSGDKRIDYTRELLRAHGFGPVATDSWEHFFLDLLFQTHSRAVAKAGSGIESFLIRRNRGGHFETVFYRNGDKKTNVEKFSWRKCSQSPAATVTSPLQRLTGLMRESVDDQVMEFKRANRQLLCGICQLPIKTIEAREPHVDHKVVGFATLRNQFLGLAENKDRADPVDAITKNASGKYEWADPDMEKRWHQYHKDKAELQWAHATCNIVKGQGTKRKEMHSRSGDKEEQSSSKCAKI